MSKLLKKFIAVTLVIILMSANMLILGEYTIAYALSNEELNSQTSETNQRNVEFNSYFNEGEHSATFEIEAEEAKIYANIKVNNAGYLENGTIEFSNANFKLKEDISNENIHSIDVENNRIVLNRINNGGDITLELPIEILKEEIVTTDYFNKETTTKFTGTYVDSEGEENEVEKEVINKLSWSGNAEAEVKVEATKYVPYATGGNYGAMVRATVTSNIKDSSLPIKETNIEITVPTLNNTKPTSVNVIATNTEATNGKTDGLDFTSENYTYDQEAGKVTINTANLEDSISWKNGVADEYLVIFLFEGEEIYDYARSNGIDSSIRVAANITVYNNEEKVVTAEETAEVKFEEREGATTDFAIESSSDISKGYLYANKEAENKAETEYFTKYTATVNSAKLTDRLEFTQGVDKFLTGEDDEFATTVGEENYAYNKRVEISQAVFNKMLGEDGEITVSTAEGEELGKINKESTLEDGKYVLDIAEKDNNELVITTSAPITEGQVEINIVKALKGNQGYSKEQLQQFEKMQVDLEGKTNITTFTAWRQMLLKEPETKVELSISKADLTTVVTNENVEIRAVLDTSSAYNALFKNPTLKITLPEEIEEVVLNSSDILLGNGLTIKSAKVVDENGHKVIEVELEGNQTEYTIDAEYKGAIIVLNTNLTTDTLTPSGTDKITMEYTNENEVATKAEGEVETEVNYVAPNGVVAANGISNYKEDADSVLSISGEPNTVEIDKFADSRVATVNGTVINNYANDISNVVILGRIPAEGNKQIDTDTELGSTFTTPLATGLGISGVSEENYTVYYSDNQDATRDLQDENNGWAEEATTNTKSYMIVFNEDYKMESGSRIEFTYDITIPENLSANNSTYNMYKVYFNNEAEIGTMEESKTSAIIGMTTGEGSQLEVNLSSSVDMIREGQIVKMRVSVKNAGNADAENVVVNVSAPEYTTLTELKSVSGFDDLESAETTIDLGTVKAGETANTTYYLRIDDYIDSLNAEDADENAVQEIVNKVSVTSDDINTSIESNECALEVHYGNMFIEIMPDIDEVTFIREGYQLGLYIRVLNIKREEALNNVELTLKLPEGVDLESADIRESIADSEGTTEGVSYDESSRTLTVNMGSIERQKFTYINMTITDTTNAISFMATGTADNVAEHYSNLVEYNADEINLEVSELTSSPRYVKETENIEYKFSITNNSSRVVTNIEITDDLPDGLTYVESKFMYADEEYTSTTTNEEGSVYFTIPRLEPGETKEITIVASADLLPDQNDKEIQNKVVISGEGFDTIETNTVTNYIEYNEEAHQGEDNPGTTGRYRITGTAWVDANMDGRREEGEQTLSNIQVVLLNREGTAIVRDPDTNEEKMTTTGENGNYQFDNLPNGEYLVVFIYDSSNYSLTTYQAEGVDSSFNSDAIDINLTFNGERRIAGITDVIRVNGGNVRDIDIGLYTANKFDLRLDKYVNKITLTTPTIGTTTYEHNNEKVAKVEVLERNVGQSSAVIEYKIVVTNEGSVPGYVNKIVDYLPEKVSFNTELNADWYLSDNGNIYNASLENEVINPGESKEVTLVVSIQITEDMIDTLGNSAEIYESYNEQGLQDIDSTVANMASDEDDMSKADVVVSIVTGSQIIMYVSIALGVMAIIGLGIFGIRKYVLNKKV